jgi:hypothetical protein
MPVPKFSLQQNLIVALHILRKFKYYILPALIGWIDILLTLRIYYTKNMQCNNEILLPWNCSDNLCTVVDKQSPPIFGTTFLDCGSATTASVELK